jgi:hypothetical protein
MGRIDLVRPFYLAGGTALVLRLGHRVSVDLDLFANIEILDDHSHSGPLRERQILGIIEELHELVGDGKGGTAVAV